MYYIRAGVSTPRPCRTCACFGQIKLLPLELRGQRFKENARTMVYPSVFPRAPSKRLSPRAISKLSHTHKHTRTSHLLPEHVIRLSLYHCPPLEEEEEEEPLHQLIGSAKPPHMVLLKFNGPLVTLHGATETAGERVGESLWGEIVSERRGGRVGDGVGERAWSRKERGGGIVRDTPTPTIISPTPHCQSPRTLLRATSLHAMCCEALKDSCHELCATCYEAMRETVGERAGERVGESVVTQRVGESVVSVSEMVGE